MHEYEKDIDIDVDVLTACSYAQIGSNTKVISAEAISNCIWVYLPPDVCRLKFAKASELNTHQEVHGGAIERAKVVWLKVFSQELNLESGQHVYRLEFEDPQHFTTVFRYISYIIQTKDVEKPYIYMKRDEE